MKVGSAYFADPKLVAVATSLERSEKEVLTRIVHLQSYRVHGTALVMSLLFCYIFYAVVSKDTYKNIN